MKDYSATAFQAIPHSPQSALKTSGTQSLQYLHLCMLKLFKFWNIYTALPFHNCLFHESHTIDRICVVLGSLPVLFPILFFHFKSITYYFQHLTLVFATTSFLLDCLTCREEKNWDFSDKKICIQKDFKKNNIVHTFLTLNISIWHAGYKRHWNCTDGLQEKSKHKKTWVQNLNTRKTTQ